MKIFQFQYNIFLTKNLSFLSELNKSEIKKLLSSSVFTIENYKTVVEIIKEEQLNSLGGEIYVCDDTGIQHTTHYWNHIKELDEYIIANPNNFFLFNFSVAN